MERKEDFPCLVCGKTLYRVFEDEGQPNGGIALFTHGNYGSTVWDDMQGQYLAFNICDSCIITASQQDRIFVSRSYVNIKVEVALGTDTTIPSIVGSMKAERPFVVFHRETFFDGMNAIVMEHDECIEYVNSGKIVLSGGLTVDHIAKFKEECKAIWDKEDAKNDRN